MSVSAASLSPAEYEERRAMLEEIKALVKEEQEHLFKILKQHRVEYSENSNGIFFDMCKVTPEAFTQFKSYMAFCRQNRADFAIREEAEARAQEAIHTNATY